MKVNLISSFQLPFNMTNIWNLHIGSRGHREIFEGTKTVEGRVTDPSNPEKDYSKMLPGDIVNFIPVVGERDDPPLLDALSLSFIVGSNKKYSSVRELLEAEGLENVWPGVKTIEEGIEIYHSSLGYEEKIERHGIYAIKLDERIE